MSSSGTKRSLQKISKHEQQCLQIRWTPRPKMQVNDSTSQRLDGNCFRSMGKRNRLLHLRQLCLRPLSPHRPGGQKPGQPLPEGDVSSTGTSTYRSISWKYYFSSLTRRAQHNTGIVSAGNLRSRQAATTNGRLQGVLEAPGTLRWGAQFSHGEKDLVEQVLSGRSRRACLGRSSQLDGQNGFSEWQSKVSCHIPGSTAHLQLWSFPCPRCALAILNTLNHRKPFHTYFPCHQTSRDSWVRNAHPLSASSV